MGVSSTTSPLETIVVGVDGSDGGKAALEFAAREADFSRSSVSQQVVQHATCPVVVVNHPSDDSG